MHPISTHTHEHAGNRPAVKQLDRTALRFLLLILIPIIFATFIGLIILWPKDRASQMAAQPVNLPSATITAIQD